MQTYPDTRIPLKPNHIIKGTDEAYVIEQFCFATRYSLVYLAHPEALPENRCALMELYPHAGLRMGGFVHRTDQGHIHIYNPFSKIPGMPDDRALLDAYLDGLWEDAPADAAFGEPALFTDIQGSHYLIIHPKEDRPDQDPSTIPFRNPLSLIPEDELVSYVLLHRHPLYRYRDKTGEIHVLCIGSGVFMQRMLLSIVSCGQLPDTVLHIHILSKDDSSDFTGRILAQAPLLAQLSNLMSENAESPVLFHYQQVADIGDAPALSSLPYARYILISLGDSGRNRDTANRIAQHISSDPAYDQQETMIQYHCPGQHAASRHPLPQWVSLVPFSENLVGYTETLEDLGKLTVRLAHMYNKLRDPRISLAKSTQLLSEDAYSQKSSCASALHLKYKLASIGIDPCLPQGEILPAYQKALADPSQYARLLSNEHARWMYYMAADQYRVPTEEDLLRYGFAYEEDRFNDSWKCKSRRFHPCLVPSSDAGIVLSPKDFQTYTTREAIAAASLDPLDKVSLTLHLLSKEKCKAILKDKLLSKDFFAISIKLLANRESITGPQENLQSKLAETERLVTARAASLEYHSHKELHELQQAFQAQGIDISGEVTALKNRLSVFVEFAKRKDYKKPDETIIQMLPWVLYGEDLKLIMLCNQRISAQIFTPLLMDPAELVFFGTEEHPQWQQFFRDHGLRARIRFVPLADIPANTLKEALRQEVAGSECTCVIDITDASEVAVVAAHQLCLEQGNLALIRATDDNRLENVRNFPLAPAYALNTVISAEDIFSLHGARKIPDENQYMQQLCDLMPVLWSFYQQHQADWNMISVFFGNPKTNPVAISMSGLSVRESTQWDWYEFRVDQKKYRLTKLEDCLLALEGKGLLKNLQTTPERSGKQTVVRLSFRFPNTPKSAGTLNRFFSEILPKASGAYACRIWEENGFWSFSLSNGRTLYLEDYAETFRDRNSNTYTYQQMFPVLKYMQENKLLHELSISDSTRPVKISFSYAHPELRSCLSKAGNLLEFYIYYEALKTGFFDDIQTNFTFTWKEDAVKNELDLILTAGFQNLFISAKSGSWQKEQLYEIKYLTDHFSVNSIPVIIYASDKVFEEGRITRNVLPLKQRAKAMGVHLINLKELDCPLGEQLVKIAQGEVSV